MVRTHRRSRDGHSGLRPTMTVSTVKARCREMPVHVQACFAYIARLWSAWLISVSANCRRWFALLTCIPCVKDVTFGHSTLSFKGAAHSLVQRGSRHVPCFTESGQAAGFKVAMLLVLLGSNACFEFRLLLSLVPVRCYYLYWTHRIGSRKGQWKMPAVPDGLFSLSRFCGHCWGCQDKFGVRFLQAKGPKLA